VPNAVDLRVYRPLPLGTPLPARAWARPSAGARIRFNAARAERVRRFFEGPTATLFRAGNGHGAIVHTKGRWERVPFLFTDWQWRETVAPLFGHETYDDELHDWVRLYTLAWFEWARKNGKSELMAALGLYLLTSDNEPGAEIYSAAGSRRQAAFVFDVAARMAELSPLLAPPRLRVIRNTQTIIDPESGSVWRVLAAEAYRNLGADPHAVLFDEIVSQPNAELWNALRTAFGSRRQPIMIAATTAGPDTRVFAKKESELSEVVARSPEREPRRFVSIRRAGEDRAWDDEEGWKEANPALGVFKSTESIRSEAREARIEPAKIATFEVFHNNRWGRGSAENGIDVDLWDENAGELDVAELTEAVRGMDAWGGLDLASTQDLASLNLTVPTGETIHFEEAESELEERGAGVVPGEIEETAALWRHWIPEKAFPEIDRRTHGQAAVWRETGLLETTPGNVLDYRAVLEGLEWALELVNLREVAFDTFGAIPFLSAVRDELEGLRVVPFRQGFLSMGPAFRELRRLLLAGALPHGGSGIMRWQAENVRTRMDPAGNEKPDKDRSIDKIDGVVSVTMGVGRAMLRRQKTDEDLPGFVTFGG
jgi:phage terminase large subunit-like protein